MKLKTVFPMATSAHSAAGDAAMPQAARGAQAPKAAQRPSGRAGNAGWNDSHRRFQQDTMQSGRQALAASVTSRVTVHGDGRTEYESTTTFKYCEMSSTVVVDKFEKRCSTELDVKQRQASEWAAKKEAQLDKEPAPAQAGAASEATRERRRRKREKQRDRLKELDAIEEQQAAAEAAAAAEVSAAAAAAEAAEEERLQDLFRQALTRISSAVSQHAASRGRAPTPAHAAFGPQEEPLPVIVPNGLAAAAPGREEALGRAIRDGLLGASHESLDQACQAMVERMLAEQPA